MQAYQYANDQQSTAQTDTELIAAPGADRKIVVLSVYVSVDAEMTVTLEDEDDTLHWQQEVAARAGQVASSGSAPLFEVATNKALEYTTSANGEAFIAVTYVELDA